MPQLQTYTASGQVRGGPVAAPLDASALDRPARALEFVGKNLEQAGGEFAQAAQQKKRENDLSWATESMSQFSRVLAEREVADAKNPTETQGQDFKQFADEQLAQYSKVAPSSEALRYFRTHALNETDTAYKRSLFAGEQTRLVNVDTANEKTTANIVAAMKATEQIEGPTGAATDAQDAVNRQFAYLETTYGKNAKNFADKMRLHLTSEVALAAAATNPNFARQLVDGAPIDEKYKLQLNTHIDAINASAMQLQQYKLLTGVRDSFAVADGKMMAGEAVEAPAQLPRSVFDIFGKDGDRQFLEYLRGYKERAEVINLFVDINGLNAHAAQAKINVRRTSGDPQKADAAEKLQHIVTANAHLQKTDAVQYLENSNDRLKTDAAIIPTLPDEFQPQATKWYYHDILQYQGHPPPNAPDPEKYLGNDITHVLSADKADKLKQELLGSNRDDQLKFIDNFASRFGGDNHLANMAWSDMISLGKEKIPMGLQFAGIINNVQTRKEFMSAQFAAKPEAALDTDASKAYIAAIEHDTNWGLFAQAWKGPALERSGGIEAAKMALVAYAHTKSANQTPDQSVKEVLQKVILDNYGFAQVHGQPIAIPRIAPDGSIRTDATVKDVSRTMQLALHDVDPRELQLYDEAGRSHFPNMPPIVPEGTETMAQAIKRAQADPKMMQYVQDSITSNGFWVAEPSGEVMKLFVAEPGREPFAVLDKTNSPLQFNISDLPNFYQTSTPQMGIYSALTEMPIGQPITAPEKALELYPLQKTVDSGFRWGGRGGMTFGKPITKTNWPTRGAYYQGTRRLGVE